MKTFYNDITIIFLTLNKVPKKWVPYHREMLEKAADGAPIISVSREPMDFGTNIIQTEPASAVNIYWQTLKAAKIATTPYIAIAEDDLIAPRKLAVEALEERFNKYPIDNAGGKNAGGELGKQWMEERLGVTLRKSVEFYTSDPVMYFQHIESIDPLNVNRKKRMSRIRALEIPYWGRSEDMIKKFV